MPGIAHNAKVLAATMYTCRAVRAGEELYYHYGDSYDRTHYGRKPHNLGAPCKGIKRGSIVDAETPRAVMLAQGVATLPEGECFIRIA